MSRMWNALLLLNAANSDEARVNRLHILARKRRQRNEIIGHIPDWQFSANYRMTKQEFLVLCAEMRRYTSLKESKISLELKVLTALTFFAMGSYQKGIATETSMDQRSVSTCIKEVTKALNEPAMTNRWIKFPVSLQEKDAVKHGFYTKFEFPGVLGAIDCTHIAIVRPVVDEPCYYNRKGYHSLNVQMICDSDLRILNVNPKFGGATHDSHIWSSSNIRIYMENLNRNGESVWLLGDSGYPQRSYLMTPIVNASPHSNQGRYTTLQVKARNCIERTFGVLKSRFRCLLNQRVLYYDPDYAGEMVIACSVLHNMLIDSRGPPTPEVNEEYMENGIENIVIDSGLDLVVGRAVRDQLINRLFT